VTASPLPAPRMFPMFAVTTYHPPPLSLCSLAGKSQKSHSLARACEGRVNIGVRNPGPILRMRLG
jgi:hypothetical protein